MKRDFVAVAAIVAIKSIAMLIALRVGGFAQISDDDYARTVIAQSFAHAPHLDPSGTSWLPFPFWIYGIVMIVFGRTLTVARALAFALGALSPIPVFYGMKSMHNTRIVSACGALLCALMPWSLWLGLAPVPEGWAGACAAAALLFLDSRPRVSGALLLVACLSRYEAWPIAAFVVALFVVRAIRNRDARARLIVAAALAALGPIAWLVNNALAHGDAFHFIARVAAFRRANTTPMPLGARITEYPFAILEDARVIAIVMGLGIFGAAIDRDLRKRWVLPLCGAFFGLAFLIYGDIRDGAPTHHAVRALIPVLTIFGAFGVAGVATLLHTPLVRAGGIVAFVIVSAMSVKRSIYPPGAGETERRDVQIARGRALASKNTNLDLTPCAYEHFALIAAFGAPERVTIEPLSHEPITAECPHVIER